MALNARLTNRFVITVPLPEKKARWPPLVVALYLYVPPNKGLDQT